MNGGQSALAIAALCIVAPVLMADFVAPYPFDQQHRELPYVPPTPLHFGRGGLCAKLNGTFYPIRLLPGHGRLFGVDAPGAVFLFGSDAYGRDVFSRVLYGGRNTLAAGALAAAISLLLALAAGIASGYIGGWVDGLLMRGGELAMALPWLYMLLAVRGLLPLHISESAAILLPAAVIGAIGWVRPARLIRAAVLSGKEREYVQAARSFGAGHMYLIRTHILPLTLSIVSTQALLLVPQYVLAEMALSYLGLGVSEPVPSWGNMLTEASQYHALALHGWLMSPALAAAATLLIFSFLSNGWVTRRGI